MVSGKYLRRGREILFCQLERHGPVGKTWTGVSRRGHGMIDNGRVVRLCRVSVMLSQSFLPTSALGGRTIVQWAGPVVLATLHAETRAPRRGSLPESLSCPSFLALLRQSHLAGMHVIWRSVVSKVISASHRTYGTCPISCARAKAFSGAPRFGVTAY